MGNRDSEKVEMDFLGLYLITRIISLMLWVSFLGALFMLMIPLKQNMHVDQILSQIGSNTPIDLAF